MKKYKINKYSYFKSHKDSYYFYFLISFKRIIGRHRLIKSIPTPWRCYADKDYQDKCLTFFREVGNYRILVKNDATGIWAERDEKI